MLFVGTVILISCVPRANPQDQVRQEFLEDSIRTVRIQDSLALRSVKRMIAGRLEILDEPPLDSTVEESYRIIVEFSWGKSPVGAMMSVLAQQTPSVPAITIHSFPENKRSEFKTTLTDAEFSTISNFLDSIGFRDLPVFESVDVTALDANRYFIERMKGGEHYAISRSDSVDRFVFNLLAKLLTAAEFSPELVTEFLRLEADSVKRCL